MKNRLAARGEGKAASEPAASAATLRTLAMRIRELRERQGITQEDLAVKSRISVSFISMIERGERSPSYETLVQISEAVEAPLSELFRRHSEEPYQDNYHRRLVEFAQAAQLSRKQVDQLISVARAMFEVHDADSKALASPRKAEQRGPEKVCSVAGCGRPLLAKGLCPSHYHRQLRGSRSQKRDG